MPIQTFDFARLPILRDTENPIANIIPSFVEGRLKGKQDIVNKEQAARTKEAEELATALTRRYGPKEKEAKIALMQAQASHAQRLGQGGGSSGLGAGGAGGGGRGGRGGISPGLRLWTSLPSADKSAFLATTRGLGYTDDEAIMALSEGKSLKQLAEASGKDLSEVEKIYNPTTPNITQMKQQEGALAEIDVLENKATEAMEPYSRKFFGYSPVQLAEAISGENVDEQARYLAARAMQPELAGVRTRLAGGSNAQEALSDMTQKSLGNSKIFEGLVSPQVYTKTQHYMNQWLKDATRARTKAVKGQISARELYGEDVPTENQMQDYSSTLPHSTEELLSIIGGG